jgi:uncharacterized protein
MKYLLVLIILAVAASQLWRKLRRHFQEMSGAQSTHRTPQAMVRCNRCGIHLPRNEAFHRAGQAYCSADHARAACSGVSGKQETPLS